MSYRKILWAFAAALLIVPACSNNDDTTEPGSITTSEETEEPLGLTDETEEPIPDILEDGPTPTTSASGPVGTVTVDGTEYLLDRALSCNPGPISGAATLERILEVRAAGPDDIRFEALISTGGRGISHDIGWTGPEGFFVGFASPVDDDNQLIVLDDGRVTGSAELTDAMGSDDTVEVTYDVAVPVDTVACE